MYGLLLLLVFSIPLYQMPGLSKAGELSPRELPRVTEVFLASIMVLQAVAVLILTPALVAGTLARERERGHLDLLAASPLSSAEIILGRLFPHYCDLVIIIAVAVPVLCILSLMGGVDVGIIALFDGTMLTSGFAIAAIAIAVSSLSERPRRAILASYFIVAGWTALPFLIELARNLGTGLVLQLAGWAWPIESVLGITNPLYVLSHQGGKAFDVVYQLVMTMGVQVAFGVFLILTTSAILRPSLKRAGPFGWRWTTLTFLFSKARACAGVLRAAMIRWCGRSAMSRGRPSSSGSCLLPRSWRSRCLWPVSPGTTRHPHSKSSRSTVTVRW